MGGCGHRQAPAPPSLGLAAAAFSDLPGWRDDDLGAALAAFRISCATLAAMPRTAPLGGAGDAARLGGHVADWLPACTAARTVPPGDAAARGFFEAWLRPYAVRNASSDNATGLFTGYDEPEVPGSLKRGPGYATPLLALPPDLVRVDLGQFVPDLQGRSIVGRVRGGVLVPYYDRAQIAAGALDSQHLALLWLASAIDGFFLEIQGSGRVVLPDRRVVRVAYAGQNGRPYVPIGRFLLQEGAIPKGKVSTQSITAWLGAHPDQAQAMMNRNPSYVFFHVTGDVPPDRGPDGALGAPLTPGRSIAVDRHFLPLGAPVFIDTIEPLTGRPLRRLMQAQDVGGAIRGPVRADIFWGWGAEAEDRAGHMQASGRDFVLLPRPNPHA